MLKKLEKFNQSTYIMILFFFVSLIVFFPSFYNLDFFWDDERFIFANPTFYKAPSFLYFWIKNSEFYKSWPIGYSYFYIFNIVLKIGNLFVYKLFNITFHAFNAFIFYKILNKWKINCPIILSLIFLVHPVHVENVSWIFQFLTIFASFFVLISYYYYLEFLEKSKKMFICISLMFFLFSLWSKSIALFYPFFLLAHFNFFKTKKLTLYLLPFFLLSLIIGIDNVVGTETHSKSGNQSIIQKLNLDKLNHSFSIKMAEPPKSERNAPDAKLFDFLYILPIKSESVEFSRLEIFSSTIGHYVQKLFFPINLSYIYKKNQNFSLSFSLSTLLLIGLIYSILKMKTNHIIFWTLILATLIPYIGVNFISFFYWSYTSDRYMYLYVFSLPLVIYYVLTKFSHFKYALIPIFLLLSISAFYYGTNFNNPEKLYTKAIEVNDHPVFYSNLFEFYLINLEIQKAKNVINTAAKKFPADESIKRDILRLESAIKNLKN